MQSAIRITGSYPSRSRADHFWNRAQGPVLIQRCHLTSQYRKSHCADKTVVRSSYLHNRISYTGKMASLYWISPLQTVILKFGSHLIYIYTVRCHYNAVNLTENPHKRHPIACPLGRGMGCLLWVHTDLYSSSIIVVMYAISCHIGLHYNGAWLYLIYYLYIYVMGLALI